MCKGYCRSVWRGAGYALALAFVLSGCEGFRSTGYSPLDEKGPWDSRYPTANEIAFAHSDFSLEVIRFTDARQPEVFDYRAEPDRYIYRYDPDVLLRGVSSQVPAIMEMYMGFKARKPKHYMVELELRKLHTDILTGTFLSGSGGRYHVEAQVVATARRATDSSVALRHFYRIDLEQKRGLGQGRGPTSDQDQNAVYGLTEEVLRRISSRISRELLGGDARHWDIAQDQPVPHDARLRVVRDVTSPADFRPSPVSYTLPPVPTPAGVSDSLQNFVVE